MIKRYSSYIFTSSHIFYAFTSVWYCCGRAEELHRLAYNKAFEAFELKIDGKQVIWGEKYYDRLANTVGGGKPKMKYHFNTEVKQWPTPKDRGVPQTDDERNSLVDDLQDAKTEFYKEIVDKVAIARPGVLALMDEAIADPNIKVGICSAATKGGFDKIVNAIVGKERLDKLDVCLAGDQVKEKKPSPMIYNMASEMINLDPSKCIVIEDSIVGLKAAKGANMNCIITYTPNSKNGDFYGTGADAVVSDLGMITLKDVFSSLASGEGAKGILKGVREEPLVNA